MTDRFDDQNDMAKPLNQQQQQPYGDVYYQQVPQQPPTGYPVQNQDQSNQNQYYQQQNQQPYMPPPQPMPYDPNNPQQWQQQEQYQPVVNPSQQDPFELAGQDRPIRHSEYQGQEAARRGEAAYKKSLDNLIGEITYNFVIVITIFIFLLTNLDATCDINAQLWLMIHMGAYAFDAGLVFAQLSYLKQHRKENICIMAIRFLVLTFIVGWLIYGNIQYYKYSRSYHCGSGLRLIMFLCILLGYFEMLKCCCIGLVVCIMIPILIFASRRAQRPNWMPAAPQFVQNLYKTKFNPDQNQAQQQCAICLMDFTEEDEIIPLPCDEKHYFHTPCITEWLNKNNNCPLCKKAITKEALNEQKKKMRSQNNKR